MAKKLSLSVILPIYNEEHALRRVIRRLVTFLKDRQEFEKYEIIAVDDGSDDRSRVVLGEMEKEIPCLRILSHKHNLGYGAALSSGFKISQYPLLLCMDADGQFDISDLGRMCSFLQDYDIIIGYRRGRRDNIYRIFVGKMYNYFACFLLGAKFKDINCGFKLLKKETLGNTDFRCHAGVFYTELLLRAISRKHRIKQVPVKHFPRSAGKPTGVSLAVIYRAIADLAWLLKDKSFFYLRDVAK